LYGQVRLSVQTGGAFLKGLGRYFGKKAVWYLITLFIAVFLNFLLPRLIPGNPVDVIVSNYGITDAGTYQRVYAQYMKEFALDKPIWEQFFIYVGNLLQGNMGTSFNQYPKGVSAIIGEQLGWTLMLQIPAILVGWILGNILGAITAYRKGIFDRVFFPVFLLLSALPAFGFAISNMYFFAVLNHWFPLGLGYAFDMIINWSSPAFWASVLQHYQLPFWTIVLVTIGGQSLGMREMSIYELNADYVKYSRLMGIKDSKIVTYVFRNAMLPQITGLALSLGTMIGGNLIAEMVFSYPGIGTTMMAAIRQQDYPLLSGCTLMVTLTVLVANFVVDIVCGLIDPRVRMTQAEEQG
jgi:peptide/nickel transport system permease protein